MNEYKKKQIEYYRKKWAGKKQAFSKQTAITNYFSSVGLNKAVEMLSLDIKDSEVLITCGGGEGFEVKKMLEQGAKVTVSDLSMDALKVVKKKFPGVKIVQADLEKLPFADGSFDFALVKDGLHHLQKPDKGVIELIRVARKGAIIIDFQENFVTLSLKKIGFSVEFEEAGNSNFHFTRKRIETIFKEQGINKFNVSTFFLHAPLFKASFFSSQTGLFFAKSCFYLFNSLFSYWGNVMVVVAEK